MSLDEVRALHMAARRYCTDRYEHFVDVYAKQRAARGPEPFAYSYTEDDYRVFPRYNVLAAMLSAVERWLPEDVATVDEARARLIANARTAQSPFTEKPYNAIEANTIAEERAAFEQFVRESTTEEWSRAEPVPFRRVLADAEAKAVYADMERQWGKWCNGYPDRENGLPPYVTLHTEVWQRIPLLESVHAALAARGVGRVLQIALWGTMESCERELRDFDFRAGDEVHWFVRGGDWMIYASPESSITFAGEQLVADLRRALPSLDYYEYDGWDDVPSQRPNRNN